MVVTSSATLFGCRSSRATTSGRMPSSMICAASCACAAMPTLPSITVSPVRTVSPSSPLLSIAALSASATRGWNIFVAIKCNNCHDGVLFTDQQYHNIGIGMDQPTPDGGRANFTKKPEDTGAFKTPTLRDIAKSAPYFHDGSAKTLEEAVDIMLAGGKPNEHLDKKNLTPQKVLPEQREDLLNFLRSLTVDCTLKKPPLPQN